MSLSSFLVFLSLAGSPFCAFYASLFHRKLWKATTATTVPQTNALCVLKVLDNRNFFVIHLGLCWPALCLLQMRVHKLIIVNYTISRESALMKQLREKLHMYCHDPHTLRSVRLALLMVRKCQLPMKRSTKENPQRCTECNSWDAYTGIHYRWLKRPLYVTIY